MRVAEILHTCADEGVAAAAVASIGGLFAGAVRAEAARCGLSVGALTASLMSDFARNASEHDWAALTAAMAGSDQPVLSGLQAMVEHGLRARDRATRVRQARDAAAMAHPSASAGPFLFRCPA